MGLAVLLLLLLFLLQTTLLHCCSWYLLRMTMLWATYACIDYSCMLESSLVNLSKGVSNYYTRDLPRH